MRGYIGNLTVADKDVDFITVELHVSCSLVNLIKDDKVSFVWCLIYCNFFILQSVSINRRGLIRSGEEFILSCEAKGPRNMSFRWFKDGLFVNANLTKR